ncbi:N-acetylmuramoyl-L-alanine amidase [Planktotalea sp.]|uniref:N-acetylmuramoyl-L-alanine amidase n=1 Tax=Planktotalea sp. TaxID=2029877 RepID=UPI003D6B0893
MKRLAIVVGHNSVKQGAVRKDTGETEFVWNSDLAKMIEEEAQDYPELEIKTFFRLPGLGYTREIRRVYEETDRWGANATVELHFNSSASRNATGTETLTSGTPASMALAIAVNQEMVAALGLKDRGVKTRSASDRGGASLMSGRAPAALIEPFFGSSEEGLKATDSSQEKRALAEAIVRGVASSMGAMPRTDAQMIESRTLRRTKSQRQKIMGAIASAAATVGLSGDATALEAIGLAEQISAALPYLKWIAPIALIGILYALRIDADAIEEARWDDHENGLR